MWRAPARMARAGVSGRCHGLKGKALGELGQERGIHGIGLGAGLHGLSEAFGGLGVDHHDIQSGVIQGDRQVEVVEAAVAPRPTRLTWAQGLAQAHMPLGRIPELVGFPGPTGLVDNQGNGFAADIDSGDLHRLVLQIQLPSV